jgi:nucleoside 2-deoxyribosyltransferase
MPALYYAAPLFTAAERSWNAANALRLRAALPGWTVLVPQEFCAPYDPLPGQRPDFGMIFRACVEHLERADLVLAVIDGADPDSGTCWEAGFAYARGRPVVALRTDWRPGEDNGANAMLTRSSRAVVRDLDGAVAALLAIAR